MQILSRSVLPETLTANRSAAAGNGTAAGPDESTVHAKKLEDATEDFEGLLIGQMLQSIRESALGGWQEQKDQSGAVALEMAESQLSKVMASNGGLGLAKSLQQSLKGSTQRGGADPQNLLEEDPQSSLKTTLPLLGFQSGNRKAAPKGSAR